MPAVAVLQKKVDLVENQIPVQGVLDVPGSAVVQREVSKVRKKDKNEPDQWYTDRDPGRYFNTKEEALEHQRQIDDALFEKQELEKSAKRDAIIKERREKLAKDFADYVPPESETARVYKNKDKDYDDLSVTKLTPENAKKFTEKQFADRRANLFSTRVINLGGYHHVIAPGSDIGLTPALERPDKSIDDTHIPLSREGTPKTYNDLSRGLDNMVIKYTKQFRGVSEQEIRERIGKDIDRMTRSSEPKDTIPYTSDELRILNEVAAVLRLDKGRVPKATSYIRQTITSGLNSFRKLLLEKYYVGAGEGGVEALRGKAKDGGEDSEGSDIEERKVNAKRKGAPFSGNTKYERKTKIAKNEDKITHLQFPQSVQSDEEENFDDGEILDDEYDWEAQYELEVNVLLGVNNCLINAIAQNHLGRNANLGELVAIRSRLGNVGEMMAATNVTIPVITQALGIAQNIIIHYNINNSATPNETIGGFGGPPIHIFHTGGLHFEAKCPDPKNYYFD